MGVGGNFTEGAIKRESKDGMCLGTGLRFVIGVGVGIFNDLDGVVIPLVRW